MLVTRAATTQARVSRNMPPVQGGGVVVVVVVVVLVVLADG